MVEITAVLAIVSILAGISATSFISARNQYILDATVEETVNIIREAQIRSVSISKSNDEGVSEIPKGWGIEFVEGAETPQIKLLRIVASAGPGDIQVEGSVYSPTAGTSIKITEDTGGKFLFFMTPFGEPYITTTNCSGLWEESSKPSREYEPVGECVFIYDTEPNITLEIRFKNKEARIKIDKRGNVTEVVSGGAEV